MIINQGCKKQGQLFIGTASKNPQPVHSFIVTIYNLSIDLIWVNITFIFQFVPLQLLNDDFIYSC